MGQRLFAVGDEDLGILELKKISVTDPVSGSDDGKS